MLITKMANNIFPNFIFLPPLKTLLDLNTNHEFGTTYKFFVELVEQDGTTPITLVNLFQK
ncbi:MAG: hypothetical protein WC758_03425 [Candidatus Woesearchaeota archaeon]